MYLYTTLIQEINTISINQMSTYLVFFLKKRILCQLQKFQQFTARCDSFHGWQDKIQSSLQKIFKYTLLLICRWFFYAWRWFIVLFCKTFVVFCTLNLYICVFVYLCIYDLFQILLSLRKIYGSMECIYIYIYTYICVCVCVSVCMWIYVCLLFSTTQTSASNVAFGQFLPRCYCNIPVPNGQQLAYIPIIMWGLDYSAASDICGVSLVTCDETLLSTSRTLSFSRTSDLRAP
jgi:hypothetical protein